LIFSGNKSKLVKEQRIKQCEVNARKKAKPVITDVSKFLSSGKEELPVDQRLYQYQKYYEGKKIEKQRQLKSMVSFYG